MSERAAVLHLRRIFSLYLFFLYIFVFFLSKLYWFYYVYVVCYMVDVIYLGDSGVCVSKWRERFRKQDRPRILSLRNVPFGGVMFSPRVCEGECANKPTDI